MPEPENNPLRDLNNARQDARQELAFRERPSEIIWIGKPPNAYPHLACECGGITLDVDLRDDPTCKKCGRKYSDTSYRELAPGTPLQKGDQVRWDGQWVPVCCDFSHVVYDHGDDTPHSRYHPTATKGIRYRRRKNCVSILTTDIPEKIYDAANTIVLWAEMNGLSEYEVHGICSRKHTLRLEAEMQEAWKLVNAMAGQEPWDRAEEWLAKNEKYRPAGIQRS